jgi:cytoskeletal protein CcmA (bactofilin family)
MFKKNDPQPASEPAYAPIDTAPPRDPGPASPRTRPALIGSSIQVEGKIRGDEDLLIEGKVEGTVELKNNSVTIGNSGAVNGDVVAHTIYVEGAMDGNLIASECVVVRKSARVQGSITVPRVSLEDGARFIGSIDMDPEAELLGKAFGKVTKIRETPRSAAAGTSPESTTSAAKESAKPEAGKVEG